MLVDKNGYPFKENHKKGRKIYWECRAKESQKCPARAVTSGIYVTLWSHTHNHEKQTNSKISISKLISDYKKFSKPFPDSKSFSKFISDSNWNQKL